MKSEGYPEKETAKTKEGGRFELKQEFTLSDIYLIFRARFIPASIVALTIATVLVIFLMGQPEIYEARSTLEIEPTEDNVVQFQRIVNEDAGDVSSFRMQVETLIQRMKSKTFIRNVASSLKPHQIRILQAPYKKDKIPEDEIPSPEQMIAEGLEVKLLPSSYILSISVQARGAQASSLLTNAVVREFIGDSLLNTGERNDAAVAFLKEQAQSLKKRLEESENALQQFRQETKMVSLEDSQNLVVARMKSVNDAMTQARIERLEYESIVEQLSTLQEQNRDLLEVSYISSYQPIPELRKQLISLKAERDRLNERYLRRHPKMIENQQAIDSIESEMQANIQLAVEELKTSYEKAREKESRLSNELKKAEQESLQLDHMSVDFNILKRQVETDRSTYQGILDRLNEVTISTSLTSTRFRLGDIAEEPNAPIWPHPIKIGIIAVIVFSAVFVLVVVILELLDNKVNSSWDIEGFLGLPLLGAIPLENSKSLPLLINEVSDRFKEAFVSIYTQLKLNSPSEGQRVLLVSSSIPSEGKSLFSCNLAVSFSQHGYKTLIMDCDMRRPALYRFFGVGNDSGYHEPVTSEGELRIDQLQPYEIAKDLHFLPTGSVTRNPTPIFESRKFAELMEQLEQHYDVIVVDTPPVGVFPDALILSNFAHELIFVCRQGKAHRHMVGQLIKRLKRSNVTLLGVVINAVKPGKEKAYYGYGDYSSKYSKYLKEYESQSES